MNSPQLKKTILPFLIDVVLLAVACVAILFSFANGTTVIWAISLALPAVVIAVLCHYLATVRPARAAGLFHREATEDLTVGTASDCDVSERISAKSSVADHTSELERIRREKERLESDVRERDRKVQAILESLQTGILLIDAETHVIQDVNATAAATIGLAREEIIGKRCHRCVCPACEGRCPITDLKQRVDNSERVLLTADGSEVPILKTVVPITLEGRAYLLESFVDLSERQQREQVLQAQLDLSVTLSCSSSLEESLSECLAIILRGLKRTSGGIFLAVPGSGPILAASQGLSDEFAAAIGTGPVNAVLCDSVFSSEPAYLPCSELPSAVRSTFQREGLKSVALVPICSAGVRVACVFIGSHRLKEMPSWLRNALETMAGHLGQTIARLEGERALRDAHTELDQILQAAAPLSVVDPTAAGCLRVNRYVLLTLRIG